MRGLVVAFLLLVFWTQGIFAQSSGYLQHNELKLGNVKIVDYYSQKGTPAPATPYTGNPEESDNYHSFLKEKINDFPCTDSWDRCVGYLQFSYENSANPDDKKGLDIYLKKLVYTKEPNKQQLGEWYTSTKAGVTLNNQSLKTLLTSLPEQWQSDHPDWDIENQLFSRLFLKLTDDVNVPSILWRQTPSRSAVSLEAFQDIDAISGSPKDPAKLRLKLVDRNAGQSDSNSKTVSFIGIEDTHILPDTLDHSDLSVDQFKEVYDKFFLSAPNTSMVFVNPHHTGSNTCVAIGPANIIHTKLTSNDNWPENGPAQADQCDSGYSNLYLENVKLETEGNKGKLLGKIGTVGQIVSSISDADDWRENSANFSPVKGFESGITFKKPDSGDASYVKGDKFLLQVGISIDSTISCGKKYSPPSGTDKYDRKSVVFKGTLSECVSATDTNKGYFWIEQDVGCYSPAGFIPLFLVGEIGTAGVCKLTIQGAVLHDTNPDSPNNDFNTLDTTNTGLRVDISASLQAFP